ncbi:uncharacterized protein [Antedon mediterranea]|uniref:uncharacterized protein n=1 Tax=Antedon mediterranea TaxID=105859 RepID=UPI003AF7BFF1
MNGVVESLIRSCRKGLDAVVDYHHRRFSALEWQTILSEVTYLINSRPLFPDGPDPLESPPITGNDIPFPHGQPVLLQPNLEVVTNQSIVDIAQRRVHAFWDCWMCHMPPQLVQRSKWFHPRENLQIGDLVLVLEPGLKGVAAPRGHWRRGIVEDVKPGKDNLVRKAMIKTVERSNISIKERPVHKLCLIATVGELNHGFSSK